MKALKCVRDIRDIPPAAYRRETDGRQQRHLCEQRQRLLWLLATYADGDGTRVFPSVMKLATSMGVSRRTVLYRLDDLKKLGFIENGGYHGESGPRIRAIKVEAIQESGVQSSRPGVQSSVEQKCNLGASGVQATKAGAQSSRSGAQSSIAHRPAPDRHELTDQQTANQSQNGGQAGSALVGTISSSTKTPWQDFIQKAQAEGLCDEMVYATPKPGEIEAVFEQLEMLGGDIELLADEIDDWAQVQSPPLHTLLYGRWTRWLEQSAGHIASLASKHKR